MKTCLLPARNSSCSTRDFHRRVPRISNFLMVFVILEHGMLSSLRCGKNKSHFPLNRVH